MYQYESSKQYPALTDLSSETREKIIKKAKRGIYTWKHVLISLFAAIVIITICSEALQSIFQLEGWKRTLVHYSLGGFIYGIAWKLYKERIFRQNIRKLVQDENR